MRTWSWKQTCLAWNFEDQPLLFQGLPDQEQTVVGTRILAWNSFKAFSKVISNTLLVKLEFFLVPLVGWKNQKNIYDRVEGERINRTLYHLVLMREPRDVHDGTVTPSNMTQDGYSLKEVEG